MIVGLGLAVALSAIWLADGFLTYPMPDDLPTRWDHYRYIAMSRQPFSTTDPLAREAPYCWRILAPLLVYLSPLDWRVSFMLITLLGLGGAALTLYAYLGRLGYDENGAIFGLVLFFSLAGLIFNLRDFYLSDPLALCAIALGFYLLSFTNFDKKSPLLLLSILILGALAKETTLALLPMVVAARGLGWRAKLGLCLAPILVVVGLRVAFPASNSYSYLAEIQDVVAHKYFGEGVVSFLMRLNFAFLGTWGPALMLVFYRPRQTLSYLASRKAELAYLAIIYVQLVVAHNVDRLLVYGFIVVIPLLVDRAVQLSADRRVNLYFLLLIGLGLQLIYFYGRPPVWASLLVCGFLVWWLLRPASSTSGSVKARTS